MMTLLDCYLPVFKLAAEFTAQPERFADYPSFRQRCITRIEQAAQDAEHQDIAAYEREGSLFATVVWLDETVLCSRLPHAQNWRGDLLQRKYFQTSLGGEAFFTRLEQLKEEHQQARVVFLFCLQSGFHGRYNTAQDRTSLAQLITEQRQRCLPESWQKWPNEAELTPLSIKKRTFTSAATRRPVIAVVGIALLYAFLLFLLFYNFL